MNIPSTLTQMEWEVVVQRIFMINLEIRTFEMDDSGSYCMYSSLRLYKFEKLLGNYCGRRRPWSDVIEANICTMKLTQRQVVNRANILLAYQAMMTEDISKLRSRYSLIYHDRYVARTPGRPHNFRYAILSHMNNYCRWQITTEWGSVIYYAKMMSTFFNGYLSIFDGPDEISMLLEVEIKSYHSVEVYEIGARTQYFTSDILLDVYETDFRDNQQEDVFIMAYTKSIISNKVIHIDTVTTINTRGTLHHATYLIKPKTDRYPNITFKINNFKGLNEGGCSHGGYVMKQFMYSSRYKPLIHGPFCTDSALNLPLITKTGLQYLISGEYYHIHVWNI